jgi:hypothetical protein
MSKIPETKVIRINGIAMFPPPGGEGKASWLNPSRDEGLKPRSNVTTKPVIMIMMNDDSRKLSGGNAV